ncbi:hypothetical protein [Bacillus haynesii]|uniref:hypothetical protein n=1 Tax=Bacillus haynesii TaxID=1925021 RepID=UPI00228248B5|nr:hypothetical protein [Bacillus haynesii]MCY9432457.1 hypothetical protein [Bacillus haynesii]
MEAQARLEFEPAVHSALSGDRVTRTGVLVLSEADHALKFYMAVVAKSVRFLNLSTKSGSGADHALKLFF